MTEHTTCQHPDRDIPRLKCGYPLPCPYHTFIIENGVIDAPPDRVLTSKQYRRLKGIANDKVSK